MNGSPALTRIRLTRVHGCHCDYRPAGRRCGFSIIDVLVSIAVIAVLVSILMPSLALVRETTRRLICASNTRQIGLGLAMYAEDYGGILPTSSFSGPNQAHKMMTLRIAGTEPQWDGLGWLIAANYLDAPNVLYCPSHRGSNAFGTYAQQWQSDAGELLSNYHYRARAPNRTLLTLFSEPNVAVVADGMRTRDDFNHRIGANVLRIDLSVAWFADTGGRLIASLPTGLEGDTVAASRVGEAWELIDVLTPAAGPGH